jgi:hypothetical protein
VQFTIKEITIIQQVTALFKNGRFIKIY